MCPTTVSMYFFHIQCKKQCYDCFSDLFGFSQNAKMMVLVSIFGPVYLCSHDSVFIPFIVSLTMSL